MSSARASSSSAGVETGAVTSVPEDGDFPCISNESVRDMALKAVESLDDTHLKGCDLSGVAFSVEYQLRLVLQEAMKFMRHSRRTRLEPKDITKALRLCGHSVRIARYRTPSFFLPSKYLEIYCFSTFLSGWDWH